MIRNFEDFCWIPQTDCRSKLVAEALVKLGYTNIKEFGGIIDWPYEVK